MWALGCCHNRTKQATWDQSLEGPRVGTCVPQEEAFQIAHWCHKNLGSTHTSTRSTRWLIGGRVFLRKPHLCVARLRRPTHILHTHWEDCSDETVSSFTILFWEHNLCSCVILLKATMCTVRKLTTLTPLCERPKRHLQTVMCDLYPSKRIQHRDTEMIG